MLEVIWASMLTISANGGSGPAGAERTWPSHLPLDHEVVRLVGERPREVHLVQLLRLLVWQDCQGALSSREGEKALRTCSFLGTCCERG